MLVYTISRSCQKSSRFHGGISAGEEADAWHASELDGVE